MTRPTEHPRGRRDGGLIGASHGPVAIGLCGALLLVATVGAPVLTAERVDEATANGDQPGHVVEGVTHGSRWLVDIQGSSASSLPLSLRPVFATGYTTSPDGRRVVFEAPDASGAAGSTRVYLARVDGTGVRPMTPSGVEARDPAWSPDGEEIAYVDQEGLAMVDLASGRVGRFAGLPSGSFEDPSFHPSGRVILVTRRYGPRHLRAALWTIPATGGKARLLVEDAVLGTWSSDGSRIAFRRPNTGAALRALREKGYIYPLHLGRPSAIWVADGDGRRARLLRGTKPTSHYTDDDPWSRKPVWAPHGRSLVYARDHVVEMVDTRTGRTHPLACGRRPAWWDARHIVIEGYDADCDGEIEVPG